MSSESSDRFGKVGQLPPLSEACSNEGEAHCGELQACSSQTKECGDFISDEQDRPLLLHNKEVEACTTSLNTKAADTAEPSSFEIEAIVDKASIIRRVNWHLLPLFFCMAMLCSIDRANLSFAALQVNHDLQFSDSVYGFGSGIFFVGYAVFAVPSTFVCASIGAPLFLGCTMMLWGSVAVLFTAMQKSWHFYLLRLLLGFAESGAYPGMWYQLALFYDEREMVLAYTVISSASSLSGVAGAPLAAALLRMDGFLGLHGWQWLFMVEGFPAVALGVAVFFILAKSPVTANFLAPAEREWLLNRKESPEAAKSKASADVEGLPWIKKPSWSDSLLQMLREWRIWYLAGIWAIISVGMDGLVFWIPLIIRSIMYGESSQQEQNELDANRELLKGRSVHTALLSGIPFTSAAMGMMVVAYLSKRTGERHWHVALPLVVGMAAVVVLPLVEGHIKWLALTMLTIGAVGIWGPHGPLLTWPAALLDGTAAASGYALIKMIGSFAAFASNAAMGELHEETGSFAIPMLLLGGLLAIGAIMAVSFPTPGHERPINVRPLVTRLRNRIGLKRSRSDPASFYPTRTFSGTLSTIREHVPRPDHTTQFEMPSLHTSWETCHLYPESNWQEAISDDPSGEGENDAITA